MSAYLSARLLQAAKVALVFVGGAAVVSLDVGFPAACVAGVIVGVCLEL